MGFWRDLIFGKPKPSSGFKKVDWMDIEQRWRTIQTLASSTSQADMKQALIQADIVIDTIMKQATVPGSTFGERLKALKTDMPRPIYQRLWQAHLKRNELVHEHGSFVAEWEKATHIKAFEEAMYTFRGMR